MINKFSFYEKGIKDIKPSKEIDVKGFVLLLKSGLYDKQLELIQKETDKDKRNILKSKLPYVTFAGTFKQRAKTKIKESSGLACFDFDDVENIKEIRDKLIKNKYTYLLFYSPSKTGLKLIVKIPKVKDDEEYKQYWISIARSYNLSCNDEATKDISRACYISSDTKPFLNPDSKIYTEKVEDISKLENKTTQTTQEKDISRSAFEYGEVIKAIRKGMNKEQVFKHMENYSKWAGSPEAYQELTYRKASGVTEKEKQIEKSNPIEHEGDLDIKTINDYRKLKKNKTMIVQDFLDIKTLNMIYSPPAMFKSLCSLDMGLSIATGKEFMGLKCKKQPVLYCDGENADIIVKERLEKFCKGKGMKRYQIPFYILKNGILLDEKKNVHFGFLAGLENTIKQYKIKVLIFDTMHRFAFYDENKADDINILYTKVFKPLIENFGITILFLHHSKKDGGYRGSGDFLGMVDVSYKIMRNGKTNKFRIINEKCRSGEISDISGEIDFGEEYIRINRLDEEEEQEERINKLKELTDKIKGMFEVGMDLSKKDVETNLELMDYEYSQATLKRVLKWLIDNDVLDNSKKGIYRRIR